MQKLFLGLLALMPFAAYAGDLWEITSKSVGPDGSPLSYTEKKCLRKDGMNPSQVLGGIGQCIFDQKSGDTSAITFTMTCNAPGMPAETPAMKIAGDATLKGDKFEMRYTVTSGGSQGAPGSDFRMTGSAEARKVGHCEGP